LQNANAVSTYASMNISSINAFQYTSCRAFLCAHSEEKKVGKPSWSYGAWAKRLGFSGTASLTMILHGQRNPGKEITHAHSSIRKVPVQKRSINGMTLTINIKDIPKAKELISKFQDELCKLMEADQGDSTYQGNVQFFPLTKVEQKELKNEIFNSSCINVFGQFMGRKPCK